MAIIPEPFINATVAIGISNGAEICWVGTGFFVIRNTGQYGVGRPYLVTNRHVFEGKDSVILRMTNQSTKELVNIPASLVNEGKRQYLTHSNPEIDIAVLPLNAGFIAGNGLAYFAFDVDCDSATSSQLRSEGFDEGSFVYMLGFPLGLVNVGSLTPICRMGCVSRIDSSQIAETGNYLIDIQNFPGNSGSPIVSRPELISVGGTKSLSKSLLVGIVHSYIPYRVPLVDTQTGRTVEVREENSGLANVHPVECIQQIIDQVQPRTNCEFEESDDASDFQSCVENESKR